MQIFNTMSRQKEEFVRGLSPYPAAWTELVQPGGESVATSTSAMPAR